MRWHLFDNILYYPDTSFEFKSKLLFKNDKTFWIAKQSIQQSTCPNLFLSILGYKVGRIDPVQTYVQTFVVFFWEPSPKLLVKMVYLRYTCEIVTILMSLRSQLRYACNIPKIYQEYICDIATILMRLRSQLIYACNIPEIYLKYT